MYKQTRFFLLICLFLAGACRSGGNTSDATSTDTVVGTHAELQAVESNPAHTHVEDPDTTDTIPASAYGINTYGKQTEDLVRASLRDRYKDDIEKKLIDDYSRKFIFFEYDLNDDGKKEIFVGLKGPYFCGSGGCSIMILNNQGGLVTYFSVTDYPIVIMNSKTNNWKDLILTSGGKMHLIKYTGKTYPSNPSVQPEFKMIPGDSLPRALNFISEPYPWFTF